MISWPTVLDARASGWIILVRLLAVSTCCLDRSYLLIEVAGAWSLDAALVRTRRHSARAQR